MKSVLDHVTKIDMDEAFERYDEKNRGYRDQILNGLDKVMKELETIREENIIGTQQIKEVTKKVTTNERKIAKLESLLH